jgi:hypothetical protein
VREEERQVLAQQPVGEERAADDRQGETQHASRGLEQQHDNRGADDQVDRRRIARALDQVRFEDPVVERQCKAKKPQRDVIPDDAVPVDASGGRIDQIREQ